MCSIIRLVILGLVLWAGYGEAGNLPASKNDKQSQYNYRPVIKWRYTTYVGADDGNLYAICDTAK